MPVSQTNLNEDPKQGLNATKEITSNLAKKQSKRSQISPTIHSQNLGLGKSKIQVGSSVDYSIGTKPVRPFKGLTGKYGETLNSLDPKVIERNRQKNID